MKRITMLVLSVFIFALMTSCSENSDDTMEIFTTVRAFASFGTEAYTADVGVGTDTDDPPNGICDSYSYFEDEVSVTVTSNVIDHLPESVDPSPIKCLNYTVEFIPHEDSPAVPNKTINHDMVLQPGSSGTIPIRLIDQEDKTWFSTHPLNHFDYWQWATTNGGVSYEYTVKVKIKMLEILYGTEKKIEFQFPLYYFDVAEACDPLE
jgi:hypothetical protein